MEAQRKLIEKLKALVSLLETPKEEFDRLDYYRTVNVLKYEIASLDKQIAEGKENFTVDNFNHQRLWKEYDKPFDQSVIKMPTDYDIENAALDYCDEENNHFAKQAKKAAYIQGAKDMRDSNIYVSPNKP